MGTLAESWFLGRVVPSKGLLPGSFPADARGGDRNAIPICALAEVDASAVTHVTAGGR
jgi:hypothetical protein